MRLIPNMRLMKKAKIDHTPQNCDTFLVDAEEVGQPWTLLIIKTF